MTPWKTLDKMALKKSDYSHLPPSEQAYCMEVQEIFDKYKKGYITKADGEALKDAAIRKYLFPYKDFGQCFNGSQEKCWEDINALERKAFDGTPIKHIRDVINRGTEIEPETFFMWRVKALYGAMQNGSIDEETAVFLEVYAIGILLKEKERYKNGRKGIS